MTRSVSTELDLEAGTYSVLMKITAKRYQRRPTVEDVIRMNCKFRQEKLLQIGLAYDLAHAKGIISETEDEKQRKAEQASKAEETAKQKAKEEAKKRKYQDWLADKKRIEREKREKKRREEHKKRKEALRAEEARKREKRENNQAAGSEGGTNEKASARDNKVDKEAEAAVAVSDKANSENKPTGQDLETWTSCADQSPAITLTGDGAAAEAVLAIDTTASDSGNGVNTPSPTEKETPPSDKPAEDVRQEAKSTSAPPLEEEETTTPDASTWTDKNPSSEESKNLTAQDKINQFISDPALKTPQIPEVQVNGNPVDAASALPSPPASPVPSLVPVPDNASDVETIVSFASSIDSDLDAQYFREIVDSDDEAMGAGTDLEDDEDLAEYANDPWNAVCVVGLRLYTKEGDVSVKVVPPRSNDEEAPLDLDDPSKGLSDEVGSPTTVKVSNWFGEGRKGEEEKVEGKKDPPLVEKLEDVVAGAVP